MPADMILVSPEDALKNQVTCIGCDASSGTVMAICKKAPRLAAGLMFANQPPKSGLSLEMETLVTMIEEALVTWMKPSIRWVYIQSVFTELYRGYNINTKNQTGNPKDITLITWALAEALHRYQKFLKKNEMPMPTMYRGGWLHRRYASRRTQGGNDAPCPKCGPACTCKECDCKQGECLCVKGGAGCCTLGGYSGGNKGLLEELRGFTTSELQAVNTKYVQAVIDAGRKAGLDIKGATMKEQVQSFLAQCKQVSGNAITCKALGQAINDAAGESVVDLSLDAAAVCQQVCDMVAGWGGAMTGELLNAYVDLIKVIKNNKFTLNVFGEIIEILKKHAQSVDRIETKSGILNAVAALDTGAHLLKQQNAEIEGLIAKHARPALQNLHVLAAKMVGIGDIKSIGKNGTDPISVWVRKVFHLAGMESASAVLVQQALKEIGLKSADYVKVLESRQFADLQTLLVSSPVVKSVLSDAENSKVLEALNTLMFYAEHPDKADAMVAELKKEPVAGGNDDIKSPYIEGEEMRSVRLEHLVKDFIFKAFARRINDELNVFEQQLDDLSKRVGKPDGVPVDPALDDLVDAIEKTKGMFARIRSSNSYLALTGYHNDANSAQLKRDVLSDLGFFVKVVDQLMANPVYSKAGKYLVGVRDAAKKMVATIDEFSAGVAARQGRSYAQGGNDGAAGGNAYHRKLLGKVYKSPYETATTLKRFQMNIKIARVLENLKRHGTDLAAYSEKYDALVARSIAKHLTDARKEQKDSLEAMEQAMKEYQAGAAGADRKKIVADAYASWKTLVKEQQVAKENFWATVEAIDLYMKIFTQGLANNPEDVGDIEQMMSNVTLLKDLGSANFAAKMQDWFAALPGSNYGSAWNSANVKVTPVPGSTALPGWMDPADAIARKAELKENLENFGTLKNLLSVFARVCSNFGGSDIGTKVFMPVGRIYSNLINFLSCVTFHNNVVGENALIQGGGDEAFQRLGICLRSLNWLNIPGYIPVGGQNKPFYGVFNRELEFFQLVIKSISAKILVVLGLRNVFDRPLNEVPYHKINNLRMIIGGAGNPIPQVDDKAVELYLRLPLLCQFYKKIFDYEKPQLTTVQPPLLKDTDLPVNDKEHVQISFVPDIDGVFSGLIRFVFRKINFDDPAAYSDEDIAEIIRECNSIYTKLAPKHPENTIACIFDDLVMEVNRRYGLITQERRRQYEAETGFRYDYFRADEGELYVNNKKEFLPSDYRLLDGEGDEASRMSNAQKLLNASDVPLDNRSREHEAIAIAHRSLIERFRHMIDKQLLAPQATTFDFKNVIKNTKARLSTETNNADRFDIVCRMLRSSEQFTTGDFVKFTMMHETVVTGLNTLSAIHSVLKRFSDMVWLSSPAAFEEARNATGKPLPIKMEPYVGSDFTGVWDVVFSHKSGQTWEEAVNAVATPELFALLMDAIHSVGNDFGDLVKVTFTDKRVHFNFGELKGLISKMFQHVGYFIELLRPIMKADEYHRFTDRKILGSFGWLQNHLWENVVLGRKKEIGQESNKNKLGRVGLDELSAHLSKTLVALCQRKEISDAVLEGVFFEQQVVSSTLTDRLDLTDSIEKFHLIGNPVSGKQQVDLRYIERCRFSVRPQVCAFNTNRSLLFAFNQSVEKFLACFVEHDKIYGGLLDKFFNGAFAEDFKDIRNTFADVIARVVKDGTGADVSANNLFAYTDYLQIPAKGLNLVAANITNQQITPRVSRQLANHKIRYPADGKNILFSTLAHIIENIMLTKNSTLQTTYSYLIENIADVSQAAREKMRANLPIFRDIFNDIQARCELYQQLFAHFDMPKLTVDDGGYTNVYFDTPGICKGSLAPVVGRDAQNGILASIKKIAAGCGNFIETCNLVLKEIGDTAKAAFLETEQGSLKVYHDKNGEYPFCPLSMLTTVFRARNSEHLKTGLDFMPLFGVGTTEFKFAYGTRSVLHSENAGVSQLPYMEQLAQMYNAVCSSGFHVDNKEFEGYCQGALKLIRYLYRFRQITVLSKTVSHEGKTTGKKLVDIEARGLYAPFMLKVADVPTLGLQNPITDYKNTSCSIIWPADADEATKVAPYVAYIAPSASLPALILQAEDTNVEAQARTALIEAKLIKAQDASDSKTMAAQNILDLGILPINVHAMARFVPLAYLYNYGYSFDRLVCELLHGYGYQRYVNAVEPLSNGPDISLYGTQRINSALDALRVSLIEPFRMSLEGEVIHTAEMMRGAPTTKGLARGKMLYELYGDVLSGYKPVPRAIFGQHERPRGLRIRKGAAGGYMGRELMHGGLDYADDVDERLSEVLRARSGKSGYANIIAEDKEHIRIVADRAIQQEGARTNPKKVFFREQRPTELTPEKQDRILIDMCEFFWFVYGPEFMKSGKYASLVAKPFDLSALFTLVEEKYKIRPGWLNRIGTRFESTTKEIHLTCLALHMLAANTKSAAVLAEFFTQDQGAKVIPTIESWLKSQDLFQILGIDDYWGGWQEFMNRESAVPMSTPLTLSPLPAQNHVNVMVNLKTDAKALLVEYKKLINSIPKITYIFDGLQKEGEQFVANAGELSVELGEAIKWLSEIIAYPGNEQEIQANRQELADTKLHAAGAKTQITALKDKIQKFIADSWKAAAQPAISARTAHDVLTDVQNNGAPPDLDAAILAKIADKKVLITKDDVTDVLTQVAYNNADSANTINDAIAKVTKNMETFEKPLSLWSRASDRAKENPMAGGVQGGALTNSEQLTLITMIIRFMVEANHKIVFANIDAFQKEFAKTYLGKESDAMLPLALACVVRYFYTTIGAPEVIATMDVPDVGKPESGRDGLSDVEATHIAALAKFYANNASIYAIDDNGTIDPRQSANLPPYTLSRFDTTIIRSVVFIQNVYRITHLALRRSQEPEQEGNVLIQGPHAADEDLTEYGPMQSSKGQLQHWDNHWGVDKVANNYDR